MQHWLLMLLRCGVLALLAVGVAEPITRAAGAWFAPAGGSAAIVLDNSLSMSAGRGSASALGLGQGSRPRRCWTGPPGRSWRPC